MGSKWPVRAPYGGKKCFLMPGCGRGQNALLWHFGGVVRCGFIGGVGFSLFRSSILTLYFSVHPSLNRSSLTPSAHPELVEG